MYISVFVCIFPYISLYITIYIYVYIYMYLYVYICIFLYVYVYICIYIYSLVSVQRYISPFMHIGRPHLYIFGFETVYVAHILLHFIYCTFFHALFVLYIYNFMQIYASIFKYIQIYALLYISQAFRQASRWAHAMDTFL